MDNLSRKKEFFFKNRHNREVRIHTHRVVGTDLNLWRENDKKASRDISQIVIEALKLFPCQIDSQVKFVIVNKKKFPGIASFDWQKNIIYVSNAFNNEELIKRQLRQNYFVAKDMRGILLNEYGHYLHWRAIKKFYKNHRNRYNSVSEAKLDFDSELEDFLKKQYPVLLNKILSPYAKETFDNSGKVNDVIAEFVAKGYVKDKVLEILIREMLEYGNHE